MEFLKPLLQREVIIALAIAGALVATLGSVLVRKGTVFNQRAARLVLRLGYAISWTSVGAFIFAGLLGQ